MGFVEPNMAARADGANPKAGVGWYHPVRIAEGLVFSWRVEALLDGKDRDGAKHDVSLRYTLRVRYDVTPDLFIEVERFAWNPITHVKSLPPGMKDNIGGGDTMSAWLGKIGFKY